MEASINERLEKIEDSLEKITVALLGNEFNRDGLIHTVTAQKLQIAHLEKEVSRIDKKNEDRWNAIKYWVMGLSIGAGFGLTKLVELLKTVI